MNNQSKTFSHIFIFYIMCNDTLLRAGYQQYSHRPYPLLSPFLLSHTNSGYYLLYCMWGVPLV